MEFLSKIEQSLLPLLKDPISRAGLIMGAVLILSLLVNKVFLRWVLFLTRKTKTELDDQVVSTLHRPLFITLVVVGVGWSLEPFPLSEGSRYLVSGVLKTITVLIWSGAALRMGSLVLATLARHEARIGFIQPRTLPLFEILVKTVVVGGAVYFAFLSWDVDVTGWLASAGIVGIAVGFAAKDTLANLFAGFFILADAPYKLGDFIVLGTGLRGRVTDIGFRSTRILTRDDIEITVPNAVIANSKIVNESGGPWEKERVRVKVAVAYGSDLDQVREVLMGTTKDFEHICSEPAPRLRFRTFGDSGLHFELMAWIDEPVLRGRVLDKLNTRVYEALNEAGIEIPYSKQDVFIKEMPGGKQSRVESRESRFESQEPKAQSPKPKA